MMEVTGAAKVFMHNARQAIGMNILLTTGISEYLIATSDVMDPIDRQHTVGKGNGKASD